MKSSLALTLDSFRFPFEYYVAIQDVEAMPEALADALRQWFEMIQAQLGL
jgi:midasin (ATPase involved in ribosome maturation)